MTAREDLRHQPFPGSSIAFGGGTIATADDRRLRDELDRFLAAISGLAERERLELGDDGLPIDLNELRRRANTPTGQNCRAIQRHAAWVMAIRLDVDNRAAKQREHRKREATNARKALRKLVQDAPALDAGIRDTATRVAASWRLVERFVDALADVAGGQDLGNEHETFREGVQQAAAALRVEAPLLEPLPDGLPSKPQIRQALDALQGRGGYSKVKVDLGGADKARKRARVLANATRLRED